MKLISAVGGISRTRSVLNKRGEYGFYSPTSGMYMSRKDQEGIDLTELENEYLQHMIATQDARMCELIYTVVIAVTYCLVLMVYQVYRHDFPAQLHFTMLLLFAVAWGAFKAFGRCKCFS